jgi:hypothetical protein
MFLKKVYRYNKWMFGGMLFFILMQLFVFYKAGMVFSPWYNYGMYSEVIKPLEKYELYKVYADGELMAGDQYSPQQWDNVHYTLLQADATLCNQNFYEKEISRLFNKFHLPVPAKHFYVNTRYGPKAIRQLYPNHLSRLFATHYVDLYPLLYKWDGNKLVETDSLKNISSNSFQCK